jgi:hypothetical protein
LYFDLKKANYFLIGYNKRLVCVSFTFEMELKFIQNALIENILQACGSIAKFSRLIYPKFDFENLNKVD